MNYSPLVKSPPVGSDNFALSMATSASEEVALFQYAYQGWPPCIAHPVLWGKKVLTSLTQVPHSPLGYTEIFQVTSDVQVQDQDW